jgi:hypothetical protein
MFCTLTDSGKNDFRIGIMNRIGNVRHLFTTGIVSGCSWYDSLYDELLIWWLFISPSILHVLYVVKNKFPCLDVFSCVSVTMSDQMMFESSCLPFGLWSLCFLMLFVFIYVYWCTTRFQYQMMHVSLTSYTTVVTYGAGTATRVHLRFLVEFVFLDL